MSLFDRTALGFFVPTSKFTIDDIPDLTGKVAIVTGANTGIGKYTAQQLLSHGATVYAACRSEDKATEAIKDIKAATGKEDIHFLKLDLGSISQSKQAGENFAKTAERLDILVNSAGVMLPPAGSKTSDDYELQFGTNVIGHFAFTQPLVPLLKKTAESAPPNSVRMVWVSSSAHYAFSASAGIDFESITDVKKASGRVYYGQSKLGNIHLANEYAKRLRDSGIISVSLHPGNIATDLTRYFPSFLRALLYAATSPEVTIADTGSYYVPWAQKYHPSHPKAEDPTAIKLTWDYCEAQVQKHGSK